MPDLFKWGRITLHSGQTAKWKIDCDALTDTDLGTLAALIAERVGRFAAVEGIPRGGLRLAERLSGYAGDRGPLLIVDDVNTTGTSLEAHRAGRDAIGYVLFARGPLPLWAKALFTLDAADVPAGENG